MRLSSTSMVAAAAVAWLGVAGVAAGNDDLRLIEAIQDDDHEAARALLEQKVDVNAREGDGATALHWAVVREGVDLADALLDAGADANAANDYGVTPLALACTNRSAALVGRLLDGGADPNAATTMGETALMSCAKTGSAESLALLFEHGASNVEAREESHGQTALMWAAAQPDPEAVRVLLAHGADVHARSTSHELPVSLGGGNPFEEYTMQPHRGSTPLLFAARNGRIENARLLLDAGADVNDKAPNGQSALVLASFSDQGRFAELLLERGADPEAADAGFTALHTAVLRGDPALVKSLCAHGADPNSRITKGSRQQRNLNWYSLSSTETGATPFWLAAKYAEAEIMRSLAECGADPLLSPDNGTPPLLVAAGDGWTTRSSNRRGQGIGVDAARLLVSAAERPTWEATLLALEMGNDANATDPDGNTAMHEAVRLAFPTVVQLLVDHGGDLDVQNQNGTSARDLICRDATGRMAGLAGDACAE